MKNAAKFDRRLLAVILAMGSLTLSMCDSTSDATASLPDAQLVNVATPTALKASPLITSNPKAGLVTYDAAKNTITVQSGVWSLPDVRAQLGDGGGVLKETTKGEWLLTANLAISKGAALRIAGPQVAWLKLASNAAGFIWLKALGGDLQIETTKVTSWDADRNAVDENTDDGRSFVLARNGSHMNIVNAEMSYLGYFANESYGVAWRTPGTTGQAINSKFGYNFYGLYAYEVSNLIIRGNEVHHSTRYGIDPHTRSNKLLIENNISHHNGKQGIILAEECNDSVIRNNTAYSNTLHGIVIYQRSNNNIVEGNTSYGNGWQGINVNDSSNTVVRGNVVYGNGKSGIGIGENAQNTRIEKNTIRDNAEHGVYLYSSSTASTLVGNVISGNVQNGIYIKSEGNLIGEGNDISGNKVGVFQRVANPQNLAQVKSRVHDNTDVDTKLGSADSGPAPTEAP